jgi:hypothetical protein
MRIKVERKEKKTVRKMEKMVGAYRSNRISQERSVTMFYVVSITVLFRKPE